MTQTMTSKGARRVPAHAVSSFPLWCKGGKHSRGVPRHQAKVAISVQRDQGQEDGKADVIVEPKTVSRQSFSQAKTAFVRIACTSCPPSNLPAVVGSLPARYWGRGPGPI